MREGRPVKLSIFNAPWRANWLAPASSDTKRALALLRLLQAAEPAPLDPSEAPDDAHALCLYHATNANTVLVRTLRCLALTCRAWAAWIRHFLRSGQAEHFWSRVHVGMLPSMLHPEFASKARLLLWLKQAVPIQPPTGVHAQQYVPDWSGYDFGSSYHHYVSPSARHVRLEVLRTHPWVRGRTWLHMSHLAQIFAHLCNMSPHAPEGHPAGVGARGVDWDGWMRLEFDPYLSDADDGLAPREKDNASGHLLLHCVLYSIQDYIEYSGGELPDWQRTLDWLMRTFEVPRPQHTSFDNWRVSRRANVGFTELLRTYAPLFPTLEDAIRASDDVPSDDDPDDPDIDHIDPDTLVRGERIRLTWPEDDHQAYSRHPLIRGGPYE